MARATCEACGKQMNDGVSCDLTHLKLEDGTTVERMRYGDKGEYCDTPCHDCAAPAGGLHHPGCDSAICPICGGQESFCDCPVTHYVTLEKVRK